MGRVAKQILQEINMSVKLAFKCNQWKNTTEVINWFEEIENKASKHFIQFDICEYYPSISEQLLMEALTWAENYVQMSDLDKKVIVNAVQSCVSFKNILTE